MSIAKITSPKILDVVHRKRLFTLLNTTMKKTIIWIAGPGGSGKTTLVADYLTRRKLPHLWYQLDEGDADLATFFYYLGLAARKTSPKSRRPLPLLTPEYLSGIHIFSRRYFENFYARLKPGSVLVFDNYQDVPLDSGFHKVMSEGISSIPDGLQIILISRSEPPVTFARLRANNAISYIGWDDLKLTLGETQAFVHFRARRKVSQSTLEQLHTKTDGWMAGLVLITEGAGETTSIVRQSGISNREAIFNYFATEVFEKIPSEIQALFMKTALLPKISTSAARRLTGMGKADDVLADITRQNFFTTRYSRHGDIYQYHPMFREFLLTRAAKTYTAEKMKSLKQKAAHVLAEDGQLEDAIMLFMQTEDFLESGRLICNLASGMFSQGRVLVVKNWVDTLPTEVTEKNPWLLYWRGICTMHFNPAESKKDFDKAFKSFEAYGERAGMFLAWCGFVDVSFFSSDFCPLDRMISLLEKMLIDNLEFPSSEIAASVSVSMFGALCRRKPSHADIGIWEKRSLDVLRSNVNLGLRRKAGVYLTSHYLRAGDFAKASFTLDMFRKAVKSGRTSDMVMLAFKSMEAIYNTFTASCENYLDLVFKTIKLGDKTGIRVWEPHVTGHGIVAALSRGDLATADVLLHKIKPDSNARERFNSAYYHFAKTWKAMIEEDNVTAQQYCEELMNASKLSGDIPSMAISHIVAYEIQHTLGRKKEAHNHLSSAYKIAYDTRSSFTEYMCLIVESYVVFQCDDELKALSLLRKAMTLGREKGFINMLWWRPAVMSGLCAKALHAGIEIEYVKKLIRKRELVPDTEALLLENWPYPLRIHTLGKFNIVKEGENVLSFCKIQLKPLLLLKALIAFGGIAVPEGDLTDALWPDADGYAAHRSFESALYRLRKLLGHDKVILLKNGALTLEERYCYVDVWALERVIKKVEEGWKEIQGMAARKKNKKRAKRNNTSCSAYGKSDRELQRAFS